jgi:hypothetical protein
LLLLLLLLAQRRRPLLLLLLLLFCLCNMQGRLTPLVPCTFPGTANPRHHALLLRLHPETACLPSCASMLPTHIELLLRVSLVSQCCSGSVRTITQLPDLGSCSSSGSNGIRVAPPV